MWPLDVRRFSDSSPNPASVLVAAAIDRYQIPKPANSSKPGRKTSGNWKHSTSTPAAQNPV
jgi:hypothetical protein